MLKFQRCSSYRHESNNLIFIVKYLYIKLTRNIHNSLTNRALSLFGYIWCNSLKEKQSSEFDYISPTCTYGTTIYCLYVFKPYNLLVSFNRQWYLNFKCYPAYPQSITPWSVFEEARSVEITPWVINWNLYV